jgi:pimeloyl-ACP methyl ester carboxylesterase
MLNDEAVWADVITALGDTVEIRAMPALTQVTIPAIAGEAWERLADVPAGVPVLVAGFSMGGYVLLEMLAQPVRPLAGVALVSTSARTETAESTANREKAIAGMQADFPKAVEGILKWATHEPPPGLLDRLRPMYLRVGAATAIRQSRAIMGRADHREQLARLTLPATVLCGRHDRITPPELSEELATLLPGARLRLVDGAGHMLPAEQPREVAAELAALVERVRATAS